MRTPTFATGESCCLGQLAGLAVDDLVGGFAHASSEMLATTFNLAKGPISSQLGGCNHLVDALVLVDESHEQFGGILFAVGDRDWHVFGVLVRPEGGKHFTTFDHSIAPELDKKDLEASQPPDFPCVIGDVLDPPPFIMSVGSMSLVNWAMSLL
jgi:hypothetical protein